MKYIKPVIILSITFLAVVIFYNCSIAQKNTGNDYKKIEFKNMLDSQHFVFVAQSASPFRGRFRNLTSLYDVSISRDTMVSYLPYFGRAYTAPMNPSESALSFTATNFSYAVEPHKKNGWNVLVKSKGNESFEQFIFRIYDNGSAALTVSSISRDPISFNGYIKR